jgi:hypothetical protein
MVPPEVETSADKNAARFSDESFVLFFLSAGAIILQAGDRVKRADGRLFAIRAGSSPPCERALTYLTDRGSPFAVRLIAIRFWV